MKKLILATCVLLSACTAVDDGMDMGHMPVPIITPVAPQKLPTCAASTTNVTLDVKAMYGAEVLYNVPADAYVKLTDANALTPDQKAFFKPKLIQLFNLLLDARNAYNGKSVLNFICTVNDMKALSGLIKTNLAAIKKEQ